MTTVATEMRGNMGIVDKFRGGDECQMIVAADMLEKMGILEMVKKEYGYGISGGNVGWETEATGKRNNGRRRTIFPPTRH